MNERQCRNLSGMSTVDDKFMKAEVVQRSSEHMRVGIEFRFSQLLLDRYLQYRNCTEVDRVVGVLQNIAGSWPKL